MRNFNSHIESLIYWFEEKEEFEMESLTCEILSRLLRSNCTEMPFSKARFKVGDCFR